MKRRILNSQTLKMIVLHYPSINEGRHVSHQNYYEFHKNNRTKLLNFCFKLLMHKKWKLLRKIFWKMIAKLKKTLAFNRI